VVALTIEPADRVDSMVSVDSNNPNSHMKLDYSGGAFRENGLVFVATIDATDQTGGTV